MLRQSGSSQMPFEAHCCNIRSDCTPLVPAWRPGPMRRLPSLRTSCAHIHSWQLRESASKLGLDCPHLRNFTATHNDVTVALRSKWRLKAGNEQLPGSAAVLGGPLQRDATWRCWTAHANMDALVVALKLRGQLPPWGCSLSCCKHRPLHWCNEDRREVAFSA